MSRKLKSVKGVETIYETTGSFDIAAIIKGASISEVNKSVEEIRRLDGRPEDRDDDNPADDSLSRSAAQGIP